jgi:putative peptidoglycan lipid II flippase
MTERINQGRPDLFKKEFLSVLKVIIWIALPIVVVAYLGRGYIVRLLVASGDEEIALLLGLLAPAIFFRVIFHLTTRSFYAQKDTLTPLKVSIISIGLNIALAMWFVLGLNYGIGGLALAQSGVALFEVVILLSIQNRRFKGLFTARYFGSIINMVAAAGLSAFVMYLLILKFPLQATDVGFFSLIPKFIFVITLSMLTYLGFSYMFGVNEAKVVVRKVSKFLFKPVKIQ